MVNPWIKHVKDYQAEHPGMSYRDAMSKARSSYKPLKKGCGDIGTDLVGSVLDSTSNADELLELADKGISFTEGILDSDQRRNRVDKRIERRDKRATHRQERRQNAKDVKQDRKNEKQKLKTDKITHKRQVKQAKHERKISKISG
eukprot:Lithocolla_globosa_v1_NODE_9270_length_726_cov_243.643815.p1 type:complete len:145 gc:universal NODE_9270_length_726_cov_243.643815:190-624(+)